MRVGVTGHQQMPDEAWDELRSAMLRVLSEIGPRPIGISSLAVGADQLFAQALLSVGGRLHVVVPCMDYESTFAGRPRDLARFRELLARATKIYPPKPKRPSEKAFRAAGRRVVRLSNLVIAAWDGEKGEKGGTADIVRYARRRKTPVRNVWPEGVDRK
jgi:hypothetical protein